MLAWTLLTFRCDLASSRPLHANYSLRMPLNLLMCYQLGQHSDAHVPIILATGPQQQGKRR